MVNVGEKDETSRTAIATGQVFVQKATLLAVRKGGLKKGDVLSVAQLAGIMGAKKTSELIPLCHPLSLSHIDVSLALNEADCAIDIRAECRLRGRTGVEMEALTGASVAALTIYDMCKALSHDIVIGETRLLAKTGGKQDFLHDG